MAKTKKKERKSADTANEVPPGICDPDASLQFAVDLTLESGPVHPAVDGPYPTWEQAASAALAAIHRAVKAALVEVQRAADRGSLSGVRSHTQKISKLTAMAERLGKEWAER